jgi:hypothetical protein
MTLTTNGWPTLFEAACATDLLGAPLPAAMVEAQKAACDAYWSAHNHDEEHVAVQRMLALGMEAGGYPPCPEPQCVALSEETAACYAAWRLIEDDQASRADWDAFPAKGLELLGPSPKQDLLAVTREIARGE